MKRPLVAVVSCYVMGLLLAALFQPPLAVLFAASFLVLVLVLVLVLEKFRSWLIWPLLALVGWTNLASRTAVLSPYDLRTLLGNDAAIATVRGILVETPHIKIVERDDPETNRTVAQIRVTGLRWDDNWQPAEGEIVVTTPGTLPGNFFAGQPVEISGVIARPPPPLAEGLFNYRDYLQTRGIFYQLKTGSTNDWQIGASSLTRPPLTDRFLTWSKHTLALGLPVEDEPLRLLWAMTWVSEFSTKIPGAFFYVPEPSWLTIGIYYAVIVGALSGWLFAPTRRIWSTAILILIAGLYFWRWVQSCAEIQLTVLPLNGGHAVFVDAAGRKNDWLVNCGNTNAVEFTVKPFLRAQGVNKIPKLVLTDGDLRNTGGVGSLDEHFGIGEFVTGPVRFHSSTYRNAVAEFEKPPLRHKILNCGDSAGCWRVLHPGAGENFARTDDVALVLLGNFYDTRVLLLSDLGRNGQSALLARTNDLRADIVIAGLPDEGEPLCDALLEAVQPKVIVIADSEFPAPRRASRELKQRLSGRNVPVIYTRTAKAVKIVTRPDGWELRTMDGQIIRLR